MIILKNTKQCIILYITSNLIKYFPEKVLKRNRFTKIISKNALKTKNPPSLCPTKKQAIRHFIIRIGTVCVILKQIIENLVGIQYTAYFTCTFLFSVRGTVGVMLQDYCHKSVPFNLCLASLEYLLISILVHNAQSHIRIL